MRARRLAVGALVIGCGGLGLSSPLASRDGGRQQPADGAIRLTLTEGTSMAAALSPDGRTIIIDLLGALWTLDANGGVATRILEDGYDARMPSWSPDGQRIAFQAYRSATWNIWTVNRDGSGLRQETNSAFDDREPHWSPDGTRLAFASDRSGNYDVWVLTLATGDVRQLTSDAANDGRPSWSPDGREIAFVSDRRERGVYAIGVDSKGERLVRAEAAAPGSPSWSPDGKTIAYPAIDGAIARLMVGSSNIADANEDVFVFAPQWAAPGGAPPHVLYTADGKIKSRPASGGPARTIEFSAEVSFARNTFTPKRVSVPQEFTRTARGLMHPAISPDGTTIAFAALGDLWLTSATSDADDPQQLTNDAFVDTEPAWSPDGTRLVFSSDRDGTMDLWVREMKSGTERKIAPNGMAAAWSPDGTRIAYLDPGAQLQIVDVASGRVRKAHDRLNEPGRPSWSPDGRAIVMSVLRPYSTRFREGTNQVLHVTLDDGGAAPAAGAASRDRWFNPAPHKSIGVREDSGPVWSPDGTQMAAIIDGHLAAFPVARDGSPLGPPRRLSTELANTPSWTRDSQRLLYQTAHGFHIVNVVDGTMRMLVPRLSWVAAIGVGFQTIHAGRLFDGRSAMARENVDIVLDGNLITRVEPHSDALHKGRVIDAAGDTVLPGLIESHAHLAKSYGEALGRIWLSFGITTVRNPAANPFEAVEDRESIEFGVRIGPRVLTTGDPIDGTRLYYPGGFALESGTQLPQYMERAHRLGFSLIKTYVRLPDVLQRRVIQAAHGFGLPVTSHEIYPAVAYGADGVEHIRGTSRRGYSPKMSELRRSYRDVIDLLAVSRMTITPTIGIQGGHQVLTARLSSWVDDVRIQRLFPSSALDAARAIRMKPVDPGALAQAEALVAPQERMVAEVVKRGGRVIAGTDAPINPYGLTLLMELEHFVRGGMSPADAIRTATVVPAEAMGLSELGTIERGKLADIVVVGGNPLVNITDLRRTRLTIKDGVVYDMDTLLRRPARGTASRR